MFGRKKGRDLKPGDKVERDGQTYTIAGGGWEDDGRVVYHLEDDRTGRAPNFLLAASPDSSYDLA